MINTDTPKCGNLIVIINRLKVQKNCICDSWCDREANARFTYGTEPLSLVNSLITAILSLSTIHHTSLNPSEIPDTFINQFCNFLIS